MTKEEKMRKVNFLLEQLRNYHDMCAAMGLLFKVFDPEHPTDPPSERDPLFSERLLDDISLSLMDKVANDFANYVFCGPKPGKEKTFQPVQTVVSFCLEDREFELYMCDLLAPDDGKACPGCVPLEQVITNEINAILNRKGEDQ